jgi:hypothetical protein
MMGMEKQVRLTDMGMDDFTRTYTLRVPFLFKVDD